MGWGGERPGAGGPRRGISDVRRRLIAALDRGLAMAGRAKGLEGPDDEVAIQSAAHIASDMILAGEGRDVLKLYALIAPRTDQDDDPRAGKSPLSQALQRLPGMQTVRDSSREDGEDEETEAESDTYEHSATDEQSVAPANRPFFAPQQPLLPPDIAPLQPRENAPGQAAGASDGSEHAPAQDAAENEPRARAADDSPGPAPQAPGGYPPGPHPPTPYPLDRENFEKNETGSEAQGDVARLVEHCIAEHRLEVLADCCGDMQGGEFEPVHTPARGEESELADHPTPDHRQAGREAAKTTATQTAGAALQYTKVAEIEDGEYLEIPLFLRRAPNRPLGAPDGAVAQQGGGVRDSTASAQQAERNCEQDFDETGSSTHKEHHISPRAQRGDTAFPRAGMTARGSTEPATAQEGGV